MVPDDMRPADWPEVARIYGAGIHAGNATFETDVPAWEDWDAAHLPAPRLVAREGSGLAGWAALSAVSRRAAYAGVAEVSVYVDPARAGRGFGGALLGDLVRRSEAAGIWSLRAGIFPENAASLAVHRKAGFRLVGTYERPGRLNGVWRDVVLLERRSSAAGV